MAEQPDGEASATMPGMPLAVLNDGGSHGGDDVLDSPGEATSEEGDVPSAGLAEGLSEMGDQGLAQRAPVVQFAPTGLRLLHDSAHQEVPESRGVNSSLTLCRPYVPNIGQAGWKKVRQHRRQHRLKTNPKQSLYTRGTLCLLGKTKSTSSCLSYRGLKNYHNTILGGSFKRPLKGVYKGSEVGFYSRGLENYLYYFGVPYYNYGIMGPKTLFSLLRSLY